jgi:hypothetical protein
VCPEELTDDGGLQQTAAPGQAPVMEVPGVHTGMQNRAQLASPETGTASERNLLDIIPVKPVDQRSPLAV